MRVYPAYGPGHIAIPNTYLVAIDTGRASESKNHDFQDVVMLLRNVDAGRLTASQPAVVLGDPDRLDPVAGAGLGDRRRQVVAHRPLD